MDKAIRWEAASRKTNGRAQAQREIYMKAIKKAKTNTKLELDKDGAHFKKLKVSAFV